MTYYIITIVLLTLLAVVECSVRIPKKWEMVLLALVYIYLVVHIGMRWETGTDWNNYYLHFTTMERFADIRPTATSPEYGYNVFVWLMHSLSDSYSVFLVAHAAIFFALMIAGIRRLTRMTYLPLLMVYSVVVCVTGSNRELLALAIGFYAIRYLLDGRTKMYLLLVALAFMFHTSALLLLFFIFLKRTTRLPIVLAILTVCVLVGYSSVPQTIFEGIGNLLGGSAGTKALFYLIQSGAPDPLALTFAGLLKRLIYLGVVCVNRKKMLAIFPHYDLCLNIYLTGLGIYFLFAHSLLILVSRGSLYFEIYGPILLAMQVLLLAKNWQRVCVMGAYAVLATMLFLEGLSLYKDLFIPYKGLFLNRDYSRTMY